MSDTENAIQWRHREVYDATGILSAQMLASHIHGALTNPAMRWFKFRFKQQWLNESIEALTWLEACQEKVWNAIIESNFSLEANEFYLDLVTFGTAIMAQESTPEGVFKFKTYMIRGVYYDLDFDGSPTAVYRQKQYTAAQIYGEFPDACPKDIKDQALSATNNNVMHSVIHALVLKPDSPNINPNLPLPPERRPVEERFVLEKGAIELTQKVRGYYEFPAYISRWAKQAGSKFGYSPAMNVLSDVLTLNQLVELILRAAEKAVDPPILAPDRGIFGDVDLRPGGITVCRDPSSIVPFDGRARFDVSQLQRDQLQETVRAAFFVDQLTIKKSPESTATEINARMQLMRQMLGPALSRVESDFLEPLLNRSFHILFRADQLPPTPDMVMQAGGELDLEYLGPLSRGTKIDEQESIDRLLMTVQNIGPIAGPEVTDCINWGELFRTMAQNLGVPAKILRTREEVDQMAAARQKAQQEQQMVAQAKEMAGALRDGAAASESLAKAEGISGGLGG